jgi:heme exporter protein B
VSGHRAIIANSVKLAFRQGGGLGQALGFVLAVIVLVPIAIGPDQGTLQRLAPGIMWLTLLLAVLLTADRIFSQDLEDGTLELILANGYWLVPVALAKALAHWLSVSLPLAIVTPLLGFLLNFSVADLPVAFASMLIGSLALSMLAAIGGAITAGLRRGGLLVTLLVLPLYIPVLIFGISAIAGRTGPSGATPALLLLTGITLITCVIAPWAAAAALRVYLR